MAVSQVSICNGALIKVGADRISSISQDTKRAILLNAIWEDSVRAVLRSRKWRFARTRSTLAPTGDEPEFGWDYEFDLPNDFVGHPEMDPDTIPYVIENAKILTDESELDFSYTYFNEDYSSWDASAVKALEWLLASEIAFALTRSNALRESCKDSYTKALGEASSINSANNGSLPSFRATSWTDARRGRR